MSSRAPHRSAAAKRPVTVERRAFFGRWMVGTLLAAAAVVTFVFVTGGGESSLDAPGAPARPGAPAGPGARGDPSASVQESGASLSSPAFGDRNPAPFAFEDAETLRSGDRSPSSRTRSEFTVAVAPLVVATADPKADVAFQWIYDTFLAELLTVPGLELVVLDAADEDLSVDEADFYLEARGETSSESGPAWSFHLNWSATRGEDGRWTASDRSPVPERLETVPRNAVDALRRFPFPPDEERVRELEALLLDSNRSPAEHYAAIDELQEIPKRFSLVGRDELRRVAVTAVEVVAQSADPDIRGRVWAAMTRINADDSYLIGPLVDSLLMDPNDYVRREAIRLLAREFNEDPWARSAFEYVLVNELSPEVRTYAKWELLDDPGRREYIESTLQNEDLSDPDRLELLVADVRELDRFIDWSSATALFDIARRARPSARESVIVDAEDRADPARFLPLLLELLANDAREQVRSTAASVLVGYLDEPDVREALEHSARVDPSSIVRSRIEYRLQPWRR